jgi:hypothetical protein
VTYRRGLLLLALYLALIAGGALVGRWLLGWVVIDVRPSNEAGVHAMIMTSSAVYVVASAIPFVPGAEIGLGLMMILGPGICLLVYLSTVAALSLAYLIGRLVPARATAAVFAFFGLQRARNLVLEMAPLSGDERLLLLTARAPRRIVPFLLRHRFLALGVAFNLPGNTLLGGGGGIALAAGMSGLYPVVTYLAVLAIAVAPVPLLIALGGKFW